MKYLTIIMSAACLVIGCEKQVTPQSEQTGATPSCEEVVRHSDELAVKWAGRESEERGRALQRLIEKERTAAESDPAVELCEESLSAEQKRCVMAAKTVQQKNGCLE